MAVDESNGPMTRPILTEDENPFIDLKKMRHPCVQAQLKIQADGRKKFKQFVPNDCQFEPKQPIILITGPNMGGKSTFLRQTCVAAILT